MWLLRDTAESLAVAKLSGRAGRVSVSVIAVKSDITAVEVRGGSPRPCWSFVL